MQILRRQPGMVINEDPAPAQTAKYTRVWDKYDIYIYMSELRRCKSSSFGDVSEECPRKTSNCTNQRPSPNSNHAAA